MSDLKTMKDQATDLDQVRLDATKREAAEKLEAERAEQERFEALQREADEWDKAMTRTFKGIFSRPKRIRALEQGARRAEREQAEAEREAA